jgi:hypothetical protein
MKALYLSAFLTVAGCVPAFAITVTAPENGARVTSPFTLTASTTTCAAAPAVSMGYSVDHGPTTIVNTSFSAVVVAGNGEHTLHVKCWGRHGVAGVTDLELTVVPVHTIQPPPNITEVTNLQSADTWVWNHDAGTPGTATGESEIVSVPSLTGNARQYSLSFTDSGGEIFHTSFGKDTAATHFAYSAQIWIDDPSTIANIEMDMNQVLENGDTVIYGVQCDGYSGTWDYTLNVGTPTEPHDHWVHSNVACAPPNTWEPMTWHSVQIAYSRDEEGNVTYESVVFDGEQSNFENATGNSAFALGWSPTLLTNFQIDGAGAEGSATVYLDQVNISRW